jgi:hypothetical protein
MTNAERIADHIGGVIMGIVLATVLALLMNWLWPEMRIPTFVAFLIYWAFNTIDTAAAERHGIVRSSLSGWKYVRPSDIKRADPITCIWGDIGLIVLGVIISFFVAGVVGLHWPAIRWLVFLVVFGLWTATIVVATVNARRNY